MLSTCSKKYEARSQIDRIGFSFHYGLAVVLGAEMTWLLLLFAGVAYFLKGYTIALVLVAICILEQVAVLLRALFNPDWVIQKRLEARVDVDLLRPGRHLMSLIAMKVLMLWILGFFAYHLYSANSVG